jgi:triphosphatase
MTEVEIKLQVAPHAVATVERDLARGRCQVTRLRATYFDTPDLRLASAGLVLRLRREGRVWVQALKASGDGLLARVEHEVACGASATMPALDLSRHDQQPGADLLRRALDSDGAALAPRFEVDVRRTHRLVRLGDARIELAFDQGHLRSGKARQPVCELELELKAGSVTALAAVALRWAERHGLWLDTRTKSERGHLLASGAAALPATAFAAPHLTREDTPDAALRAGVRAALAQWLPNASALAAGTGAPEHLHQARIGLRRLLALLREFGVWSEHTEARWVEGASHLFGQLGAARDRDALQAALLPALRAAGAPPLVLPEAAASGPSPQAACRSIDATRCAIELLAFAHGTPAPADAQAFAFDRLASPLGRLHRQARRAGQAFATLSDDERHRARRRIKRLRYAAEAVASLLPRKAWRAYLARLKVAQDALGRYQDLCLAQALFDAPAPDAAGAWFARGWLAARRDALVADAGTALSAIGKRPHFMR